MVMPEPTSWKIAPAGATDIMRRQAAHVLRLYVDVDLDVAMEVAGKMWEAMMRTSPPLPEIVEEKADGLGE